MPRLARLSESQSRRRCFPAGPLVRQAAPPRFLRKRPALVLVLLAQLVLGACSRFLPKRLSETDRRRSASLIRKVIEKTGGARVWVKTPRPRPSSSPGGVTEVVVASGALDEVLAAMRRESESEGLRVRVQAREGPRRSLDVRVLNEGELVSRWRLRPVARLRRAAIVIDDLGQDPAAAGKLLRLPCSLTFSVLPHLPHSAQIAEEAHLAGAEVMLHLPMQPEPGSRVPAGPGEVRLGMSREELARTIEQDLASVPHCAGVNNHMGSRATANAALMTAVMQVLAEHHLYFVDSRTTVATVALECARREGLPAFYRSVFLDDTETVAYTQRQLRALRQLVEEQNAALAIGHPYPTTIEALAEMAPEFDRADIELVPASELVRLPEVARLSPPPRPAR